MQEALKELKRVYLDGLKAKKAEVEAQKDALIAQKTEEKKLNYDETCRLLDEKLAEYIAEKQAKLNEEIAQKRQEVADKKVSYEETAKLEAEVEANAEVSKVLQAFESEIHAVEKELED